MEADILPVAACLIACPHGIIALRAGPSVKGNDIGTGILNLCHRLISSLHAAELEGIAGAHPRNVRLKSGHTCSYLRVKIAEKMPGCIGVGIRLQITLSPESGGNTFLRSIICKLFQVRNICRNRSKARFGAGAIVIDASRHVVSVLSVSCSIAVVWQEIANRHIIFQIFVQNSLRRPFIRIRHTIRQLILIAFLGAVPVQALARFTGTNLKAGTASFICGCTVR